MEMEEGHNLPKIAPNRMKLQENMEKGGEDRISELPDCLLLEILSRLPSTKDAIRAGTFSKRWKYLWTLVPTLIFSDHRDLNWSNFASFVDKTLTQRRQLKLKNFELHIRYNIGSELQVNSWIRYAINCKVEELIFMLGGVQYVFSLDRSFFINTYFTDLTLSRCMFNPTGAISWKNVRRLCITSGKFDEDLMENILSGSPQLETLVLNRCYGFRRLDITSKRVKNLVFSGYRYRRTDRYDNDGDLISIVKINAPNISSLTIQGYLYVRKLLLVNVSSLVEANLDYTHLGHRVVPRKAAQEDMLIKLIVNLLHVKELKIGVSCSEVISGLEAQGLKFPSNVKCPGVTRDRLE